MAELAGIVSWEIAAPMTKLQMTVRTHRPEPWVTGEHTKQLVMQCHWALDWRRGSKGSQAP